MEWEYRVEFATDVLFSADFIKARSDANEILEDSMNMQGKRGWELVQVVPVNSAVTFIYKQPKPRELGKEY